MTGLYRLYRRQSDIAQRGGKMVDDLYSVNTKHYVFNQIFNHLLSDEPINMDYFQVVSAFFNVTFDAILNI